MKSPNGYISLFINLPSSYPSEIKIEVSLDLKLLTVKMNYALDFAYTSWVLGSFFGGPAESSLNESIALKPDQTSGKSLNLKNEDYYTFMKRLLNTPLQLLKFMIKVPSLSSFTNGNGG